MKLVCPHCNETFELSASQQTALMNQIRDAAFNEELSKREKAIESSIDSKYKIQLQEVLAKEHEQSVAAINAKVQEMNDLKLEYNKKNAELQSSIDSINEKKDLELKNAVAKEQAHGQEALRKQTEAAKNNEVSLNRKYAELEAELNSLKQNQNLEINNAVMEERHKQEQILNGKNQEISDLKLQYSQENNSLKSQLQAFQENKNLEVKNAVIEATVKQKDAFALEAKKYQDEIDYYKDLKAKMSTKMIGETLEQHCMAQFNQYRMMAFPNAYFEKDNEVSKSGSKGDFIYREEAEGVELLSIMFEMKNENDTTATKHKNEDFLKELDKDRREKKCEYAILVSLLESDSEFYNNGIVDMSYKYPKMYVIRPQFFIQIIGILRNAALNSLDARLELKQYQDQNIDILAFQTELDKFQKDIGRNYDLASKRFSEAVTEIDKSIEHLQKVRNALVKSEDNLRLIDQKTQKISAGKLTKNSPSLNEQLK